MKQALDTETIRRTLDRASSDLDRQVLAKLRVAREQALTHFEARKAAPAFAWAWGAHGADGIAGTQRNHYYWAIAILLAALFFSSAAYWTHTSEHEASEVDIAILTDDLPLEMYAD